MTSILKRSSILTIGSKLKGLVHVLAMPALSPSMSKGTITQLYNAVPGSLVEKYHVFADIRCTDLMKASDAKEEIELEIELQDDLIVASIFKPVGSTAAVGVPIAVFCEDEEDVQLISELDLTTAENLAEATKTPFVTAAVWQAYVKSKDHSISCG